MYSMNQFKGIIELSRQNKQFGDGQTDGLLEDQIHIYFFLKNGQLLFNKRPPRWYFAAVYSISIKY